jgi:uncharacterized membrane protein YgdD (TMEM256/DUF423 family)
MNKSVVVSGAILGMLAILLGAFGAHGLKALLTPEAIAKFEVGVRYQMYHALFLLVIGGTTLVSQTFQKRILYLVIAGVLLFSGSIYGLATNTLSGFDFRVIGFVTPIGGLLLILAWVLLMVGIVKKSPVHEA